ncbi:solute carrier family 22 member 4-like [Episyrphus balteatus]|uniref:solute carrier family 22 member 4-like n=1 Tax=Episyrphus balteatus TaxID=286459 RepID=UPI0024865592|nr:solute carrier family 22 member 4-like [Episyrphus balteatus]
MPQVKNPKTRSDSISLDSILVRIGQFGKFQILNYILLCIPILLNAILTISYVFIASTVVHRCQVPGCDSQNSTYQESWVNFAIPKNLNGDLENCQRYVPMSDNGSLGAEVCSKDYYNQSIVEECGTDFIFRDKEVTISNDFNIYCGDEWKLALVGTINNVGQFIGIPLGGYLSDSFFILIFDSSNHSIVPITTSDSYLYLIMSLLRRYGRRNILAICGTLSAVMGVAQSFTVDYFTFMVFGLLTNIFGSSLYSIVYVLGLEMVSPEIRVIGCTIMTTVYDIGQFLLAVVAKYFPNWRLIQLIFFIPSLFQIVFLLVLPESVRWLLSQGEEKKATKIIKNIAKSNNRKLSEQTVDKLLLTFRYKLADTNEGKFPIKETFRSLFWRIANCSLCWFTNVLLYYGLNMNLVLLGGNKYDNFMLVSLVEIPGILIPFWTMNRFGRRYSLFGFMMISGISIATTVFVRSGEKFLNRKSQEHYLKTFFLELFYLQLVLFLLGKLGIAASFQVLYFFTSEIFPTNVRNSLLSFCSMVGRFGSMVAPQTPVIAKFHESAPAIIFSGFGILSAGLTLFFPETNDMVLPSTLQEAEQIGQKNKVEEIDIERTLLKPMS